MTPAVTVVIPTRNRQAMIARALDGVLAQTGVDVEVFIVDEASSDGTQRLLAERRDPRVSVLRRAVPQGVSSARNAGLRLASHPWIAFTDDDDLWAPGKLAAQVAAGEAAAAGWVAAGSVTVDEGLRIVSGMHPPEPADMPMLHAHNIIPGGGSGTLVRTELARRLGGFDESISILADWDMWIRLHLAAPLATVDRPLMAYLRHSRSMSHDNHGLEAELVHVSTKHASARHAAERQDPRAAFGLAQWRRWNARMQVRAGRRFSGARSFLQVAFEHGDRRSYRRALAAATVPGMSIKRWQVSELRQLEPEWIGEAEAWLATVRSRVTREVQGKRLAAERVGGRT